MPIERLLCPLAEGVFTIDEQGDIQSFSAAAEAMFGYKLGEITGKHLSLLIPSLAGDAVASSLANFMTRTERGALSVGPEMLGRRKDGTRFPLEVTASAVPGTRGLLIGLVRDLTALKEAQRRSLQAEGLEAIGKMIAGLAHESRNALQRSQACLEMLQRELHDRPSARDLIAKLQKSQDDLLHVYESVREYASPLKLHPAACRLDTVLCEAWGQLAGMRMARKVDFHAEAGMHDVSCEVDSGCMKQVFRNILENSLATCRDPVQIDVTWSEAELEGRPALGISLRNNGPPFTPEERRRIFDAFFTTRTHGSGLGMAIAQRIVQAHGGRIAAGEDRGKGAEIVITLPRGPA